MSAFFDSIRASFGPFNQSQVDGFNALLMATEALPVKHRAYVLATAWHETARTMQPIYERGPKSYFDKYDAGTPKGRALGNTMKGDGYRFRGVGYVQLTGRRNFAKMSDVVGHDLVAKPALAADPAIAAKIIVEGMARGIFTTRKMSDFDNYRDMRRVVNGMDRADDIAKYAMKFEIALRMASEPILMPAQAVPPAPAPTQPTTPTLPPAQAPAAPRGLLKALIDLILSIFKRKTP